MKPPFKGLPDCSKRFLYFFFNLNAFFKEWYNCKAKFKQNEEKIAITTKCFSSLLASFLEVASNL